MFILEVDVVGVHEVDTLVVLARKHGVEAVDFAREESHAFVLGGRTVQGDKAKVKEIRSLRQFRHYNLAIKGGEGRVVDVSAEASS